jgi:hypothetical protein
MSIPPYRLNFDKPFVDFESNAIHFHGITDPIKFSSIKCSNPEDFSSKKSNNPSTFRNIVNWFINTFNPPTNDHSVEIIYSVEKDETSNITNKSIEVLVDNENFIKLKRVFADQLENIQFWPDLKILDIDPYINLSEAINAINQIRASLYEQKTKDRDLFNMNNGSEKVRSCEFLIMKYLEKKAQIYQTHYKYTLDLLEKNQGIIDLNAAIKEFNNLTEEQKDVYLNYFNSNHMYITDQKDWLPRVSH